MKNAKLVKEVDEILYGAALCSRCSQRSERTQVIVIGDKLRWFCRRCGAEWNTVRVRFGPKGTLTPIDEQRETDR